MKEFLDYYGNKVQLSFSSHAFDLEARHVLVICRYQNGWLLTHHKNRGMEFPGGKVEHGESIAEAALREVYEETGAIMEELTYIGEYKVTDITGSFVKAIFYGRVQTLENVDTYHETNGPVFVDGDLLEKRFNEGYSFIMKDRVIEECLKFIKNKKE